MRTDHNRGEKMRTKKVELKTIHELDLKHELLLKRATDVLAALLQQYTQRLLLQTL